MGGWGSGDFLSMGTEGPEASRSIVGNSLEWREQAEGKSWVREREIEKIKIEKRKYRAKRRGRDRSDREQGTEGSQGSG